MLLVAGIAVEDPLLRLDIKGLPFTDADCIGEILLLSERESSMNKCPSVENTADCIEIQWVSSTAGSEAEVLDEFP